MIRLIQLNNPRIAQAFIDYMASQRTTVSQMPEGDGQFVLWLHDDAKLSMVQQELELFLKNPNDKKYQAASWDMAETRTQQFSYSTPSFMQMIKAKAGPMTLLVMLVCIVIYGLRLLGMQQQVFSLLHFPAMADQQWQVWRYVTHAVLHFSVLHITFNLLWWWQLGGDIEQRLGRGRLTKIFLVSALLSGCAQYWIEGANFGGLSGVVYALVGYIWVLSVRAPQFGLDIPKPILAFMLIWLVLGFVQPFMAIANAAHLAGLGAGCLLGWLDSVNRTQNT
ncbi:rhomboid family intramembrane serine protease GlpG [Vibrio breoganii]|uniref:Rhomboid family intramembrane serine protease GlpG n=1 Tax=Vibrio breoganii TaxID=553239 RepID=A0AAP8MW19_9VIBR|nr:rhomboid family intramembrane serine protease GlpG [Vibrio breoganii]PMP05402.1 rhomboid family intramembrane serine protease GlpG [Vibrio breoganii]PMP08638.1 rhomboid family intramembrane serine protease GlpG [Vibrio breoganii]